MGVVDGLFRLVIFLTTQSDGAFGDHITTEYEEYDGGHGDIRLVAVEGYGFRTNDSFRIIRHFLQVAVHLHQDQGDDTQYQGDDPENDRILVAGIGSFSNSAGLRSCIFICHFCIDIGYHIIYILQGDISKTGHHGAVFRLQSLGIGILGHIGCRIVDPGQQLLMVCPFTTFFQSHQGGTCHLFEDVVAGGTLSGKDGFTGSCILCRNINYRNNK